MCTACVADAFVMEPEWVEVVSQDLPLPNLPADFVGKRVVQISDLHRSRTVRQKYLLKCVERINALKPDIVVMTGDYVTRLGETKSYKEDVVELAGEIQSKHGVFATLGNHDYGVTTRFQKMRKDLTENYCDLFVQKGINVLRNTRASVKIAKSRLWLVGLGDLWARDFKPEMAFDGLGGNEVSIALSHNPDTIIALQNYSASVVMSGHTHGGQVQLPFIGAPLLPIKNKQYANGMFVVADKLLYVNRGLGRLGRVRFNCRPEITLFTLTN